MKFECKNCGRKFITQESLDQHSLAKHPTKTKNKKTNLRKILVIFLISAIIIFSSLAIYINYQKPGEYDGFAKCLSREGAVVYGDDFCSYTNTQLNFFGKSKKHLDYVKCIENEELCNEKNVGVTPTWEIKGKMYEQVQNFETLSILTGCEI